jgi:hypothetical protein
LRRTSHGWSGRRAGAKYGCNRILDDLRWHRLGIYAWNHYPAYGRLRLARELYLYSKTTTYVDQNGNPVSTEVVRSGVPVTVYYTQDGDRMIASKVVVRRTMPTDDSTVIKKTTTTTTTTTPAP